MHGFILYNVECRWNFDGSFQVEEVGLADQVISIPRTHPAAIKRLIYAKGQLNLLPNKADDIFKVKPPLTTKLWKSLMKEFWVKKSKEDDESVYHFFISLTAARSYSWSVPYVNNAWEIWHGIKYRLRPPNLIMVICHLVTFPFTEAEKKQRTWPDVCDSPRWNPSFGHGPKLAVVCGGLRNTSRRLLTGKWVQSWNRNSSKCPGVEKGCAVYKNDKLPRGLVCQNVADDRVNLFCFATLSFDRVSIIYLQSHDSWEFI